MNEYCLLWSVKEYKKIRLRYFGSEWEDWEKEHLARSAPSRMPDVPFGPGFPNPFGFDLDQLMRMLQSQGPVNLDIARQVATAVATADTETSEPASPSSTKRREPSSTASCAPRR